MSKSFIYDDVLAYLGGPEWLKRVGVRAYDAGDAHVCLKLLHPNPRGVSTVTIAATRDCYAMECFGRVRAQSFSAPLLGSDRAIAPEQLSARLAELTGDEKLHNHLFDTRLRH